MSTFSDYLFAHPSFLEGMGRTLDLFDTLTEFTTSPTPEVADSLAMYADWVSVGNDLRAAFGRAGEIAPQSAEVARRG